MNLGICECKKGTAPSQAPPNSGLFYMLSIFYSLQDYGSFWVNKLSVNQPESLTAAIKRLHLPNPAYTVQPIVNNYITEYITIIITITYAVYITIIFPSSKLFS